MPEKDYLKALEAIKNPALRGLVQLAIHDKFSDTPYNDTDGQRVSMIVDPLRNFGVANIISANRAAFCRDLIDWAINPNDETSGKQGHGFTLLITNMIAHHILDSGLMVVQSPGRLDFQKFREGETVDIVIGKHENRVIRPVVLIETKISSGRDRDFGADGYNKLLKMPVLGLRGDSLLGGDVYKHVKTFANPKINPIEYASVLAQANQSKFQQILGF